MAHTSSYLLSCYDTVAHAYANRFANELAHKPLDRELLTRFAAEVRGRGPVLDLGCGPGQTTAFLHNLGVQVCGLDLSTEILREARARHPGVEFEQGDMLALTRADASLAGVVAFYAIIHFTPPQLRQALAELHRVLMPGGLLLLAFHVGEGAIHVEEFLGHAVALDFMLFAPCDVEAELSRQGFAKMEVFERDPYPDVEYPSRRAYVFARKSPLMGDIPSQSEVSDPRTVISG